MKHEDLDNPHGYLDAIYERIQVLESRAPLDFSAITRGTLRISVPQGLIVNRGGSILLEGLLDATGTIDVTGFLKVSGEADISGLFTATGETFLNGPTTVNGATVIKGQLTTQGNTRLEGLLVITGDTTVESAFATKGNTKLEGTLEISGATTVKNNFKTEGNSELGGTLNISGATTVNASLTVKQALKTEGNTELGGTLRISGNTDLSATLTVNGAIVAGGVRVENNKVTVSVGGNTSEIGAVGISSTAAQFNTVRVSNIPELGAISDTYRWVMADSSGNLIAIPQSVGGPMGDLRWPFDPATNTDEFGPRPSPGAGGSTDHKGMDFGIGITTGEPIRAAGSGTVLEIGTNPGAGFGYYVVIQHSNNITTTYAHMVAQSSLTVGARVQQGAIVGLLGNTGTSTGPHLHFQVEKAGVPVNPRDILPTTFKPW